MNMYGCSKLFEPYMLKGRLIKNRLMRSAMVSAMADTNGFITNDNLSWYRRAAEGGVGLLVVEGMAVNQRGRNFLTQISAYGEERLEGLKKLADVIHSYGDGTVVMAQITSEGAHDWGYSYGQENTELGLDAITEEDIFVIIEAFAESAFLLQLAGFDGIELHGGHGYLISQFLSPATNNRTDKWGGTAENRRRFTLEIYRMIRKRVERDFLLGIKMNTADYLEGGNWLDDTSKTAMKFAQVGFDLIEMSGGMGFMTELREALRKKAGAKEYYFEDAIAVFVEAVKGTDTALAACGGIRTPQVMEELLGKGIDFISLARPFLCEPDFANRVKSGDLRPSKCLSREHLCNLCLTKVALGSTACVKFFPGDCVMTCPIGQDNPTFFSLIAERRFEEALAVVKKDNPLAGVLSRVCHHPCETICRGETGEPLAILDLKRFITDYGLKNGMMLRAKPQVKTNRRGKVAIIGSGPAGLVCGFYLAQRGYSPTIFEKLSVKGGLLAIGISDYKLPKEILKADVEYIESAGVEIRTEIAFGQDFTISDIFDEGYKAIFLSIGASLSSRLEIEGTNLDGVFYGLDFHRDVNVGNPVKVGKSAVVIGGGNVAVDAAMSALRLGAKEVQLVCLESREEMPAYRGNIKDAEEEGIIINCSWGPQRIKGNGKVTGVDFKMCTSVFDEQGKFNPQYDETTGMSLNADTIIIAIGETPDLAFMEKESGFGVTAMGTIKVNNQTLETDVTGVFAGGDMITGPKSVVDAVAAGKSAAESIDRFLEGRSLARIPREEYYSPYIPITRPSAFADPSERILKRDSLRAIPPKLSVKQRKGNFREIVGVLSEQQAIKEAKRCLKFDFELDKKSMKRLSSMGKASFVLEPLEPLRK